MDALSSSIVERRRLISSILDELDKAEQGGEREKVAGLRQRLDDEVEIMVTKIKLLREKQLPAHGEKPL